MAVYVALLRAINVGGTGKLPMRELVALCEDAGFRDVKTYIQSGNVVFTSKLDEAKAQAKLSKALAAKLGKVHGLTLRSARELDAALAHNPFKKQPPNRVMIIFMNDKLAPKLIDGVVSPDGEELAVKGRELYIHYPSGLGRSKLKLPFAKDGTARNINTVTKLAELAHAAAE
ncbi:MAG: DUF1697 domain-containing protein [Polyangiales bacterium]